MRQDDVPSGNRRRSRSGLTGAGGSRSRARGQIRRTYTTALNGYAAQLSGARAERLAADPAVASVEQDRRVHSTATQTDAPWGLDRIDQPDLPLNGTYTYPDSGGGNSTVFVLDTGVRITHQDIAGRASYGWDFVDNDATAQDGNGHGTHVATTAAGTTYGVAKKAKIVAARVLDNNGSGTTAGVIAGVDWITANRTAPSVANVSLGGGASTALDDAVRRSITAGWATSDTATHTGNGTSFAAPHVAGAAAVHLTNHPGASPAAVGSALVNGATSNVLTGIGSGSPDKLLRLVP
ncbi:S8 family serine peptidase [Streptomyces sp. NPDC018055]|uniref:S8 family serine peptidase n=1 Tax=Streptomyces sp. NPDC018055 TaxID=3365038 RepID=UPI00379BF439